MIARVVWVPLFFSWKQQVFVTLVPLHVFSLQYGEIKIAWKKLRSYFYFEWNICIGDVPAFVDVFGNMDASRFEGDSLIDQWFDRGYKVTMFGDETWHRLWGDKFVRSDPVTFFVNEYVQVDLNVSRHLEKELKRDDWQVMILHFGGLDHIGHLYGAFSSLSPGKLEEMDRYITQILDGLKKNDKGDNDWMLAVTSDHGQADAGGHGGPTENEVLTPLLIASPLIKRVSSHPKETLVKQIDITSTLAYLTGVPVPAKNSGEMILTMKLIA